MTAERLDPEANAVEDLNGRRGGRVLSNERGVATFEFLVVLAVIVIVVIVVIVLVIRGGKGGDGKKPK